MFSVPTVPVDVHSARRCAHSIAAISTEDWQLLSRSRFEMPGWLSGLDSTYWI